MTKIDMHIEIVASTERGLSSMGPKSRRAIQAVLSKQYAHVGITMVNNISDLAALAARKPDVVFLGMKFIPKNPSLGITDPNKIWLSEYLGDRAIAYTGSGHGAISLEFDKELAKMCILRSGLPTAPYMVIKRGQRIGQSDVTLTYPLFVKPRNLGGGKGIDVDSLVRTFSELQKKIQSLATNFQSDALIEEYLPGREFSVGILKDMRTNEYVAMPIELVAPVNETGARFLSSHIKNADTEEHMGVTNLALKSKLNTLALDAFHALGAQDYGRIDIRLDGLGEPHFLEANLLPSLGEGYGNFPKTCLLNAGLSYPSIISDIVSLAVRARQNDTEDAADEQKLVMAALHSPIVILASN